MKAAIYRWGHFNAAHRLYNPKWSEEKNKEVFGICTNPNYHGHNYEVVVKVIGEVDPETGFVINLFDLKNLIEKEIEDRFDHKNLNLDCPEFRELLPTAENVCYVIWTLLRNKLDEKYHILVRLYETQRNFVEYPAE
ncbi:MAG TPA: 6-carboxytetrahydropterin synthase [Saprospiraceae bacterium]|nr:6-carboxytetrahydropterin synthase [Saprospiraceae bacterium]